MFFNQLTIAKKIMFWFIMVPVLPLVIIGFIYHKIAESKMEEQVLENLKATSMNISIHITEHIEEKKKDIKTLSLTSTVIDAFTDYSKTFKSNGLGSPEYVDVDRKYRSFFIHLNKDFEYNDIIFINKEGDIVFTVKMEDDLGTNLFSGLYKETELAKSFIKILSSRKVNLSSFQYYTPLKIALAFICAPVLKEGRLIGVIAFQLHNKKVYERTQDFRGLGKTGEMVIAIREGDEAVFIFPLRHDPNAAFKRRVKIGSKEALPIQEAVQGRSGSGFSVDYRNKNILAVWKYLPELQWGIVTKIDTSEAHAHIYDLRNKAIFVGIVTILIVVMLALRISNSISNPIKKLQKGAETIGAGNLDYEVGTHAKDEIGQLSRAFDKMTKDLKESTTSIDELNKEVAEHKKADEALQNSEDRLKFLVSNNPAVIYTSKTSGDYGATFISENVISQTGYESRDFIEDSSFWVAHIHPGDKERVLNEVLNIFKKEYHSYEYRFLHKDGSYKWILDKMRLMRDEKGKPLEIIGYWIDITERKKAEELLKKQAIDLEASLVEALKSRKILTSMLDDNNEIREKLKASLNEALESREVLTNMLDDNNQIRENLEKSKDNLNEAQRIAHVGNWDLNLVTNELKWSDEVYRMFGLKRQDQESIVTYETFLNTVHPDDREFVDTAYKNSMKPGSESYDIVHRIIKPDGEVRYVHEIAEGVEDETGKRIRTVGTVQDITESKKKEEEIKIHVEHLNALRSIDMAITGSLDLRVTLDVFLEHVIKQLSVDAADIMLLNPHAQRLEYAFSRGFRTRAIKHASVKLGEGYVGRIALERKPLVIPDILKTSDKFSRSYLITDEEFKTYVGTPLITKGLVKGVLEIFHRSHFDPDEEWLEFFEALATQAAIAIDNATLFNDLQRSHDEIALAYDTTIEGWSKALDYRDKETEGHSQRVAERTIKIARKMGIDEEKLIHMRRGALLHDIGKLGVPDSILLKPGKLTDDEWKIMKRHPVIAYDLLSPIHYLRPAILIPYCHHEKWDGTGYPRGLKGETIPIEARIFAIIDIWDALTSDRPYRPAWSKEKTRSYMRSETGKQFDPEVVKVFLKTKF